MGGAGLQLIVLAAIAIVMIFKLKSLLGTREGFEPKVDVNSQPKKGRPKLDVIEGGIDQDIADHTEIDSPSGQALNAMKRKEPEFLLTEFMGGAGQAYEMILMAYEGDDRETLERFLAPEVYEGFSQALDERADQGLRVDAEFVGLRENKFVSAEFNDATNMAEITLEFKGELTSVVTNLDGTVVEGSKTDIKRQKDIWTFAREMGSEDPNWQLIATEA